MGHFADKVDGPWFDTRAPGICAAGFFNASTRNNPADGALSIPDLQEQPQLDYSAATGLTLNGLIGINYRIEYCDSLASPIQWQILTSVVLASESMTIPDTQAGEDNSRFYRAVWVE